MRVLHMTHAALAIARSMECAGSRTRWRLDRSEICMDTDGVLVEQATGNAWLQKPRPEQSVAHSVPKVYFYDFPIGDQLGFLESGAERGWIMDVPLVISRTGRLTEE